MIHATLNALDGIESAILTSKVAGEEATVVETDTLSVVLQKQAPDNLIGGSLATGTGEDGTQVGLPDNFPVGQLIGGNVEEVSSKASVLKRLIFDMIPCMIRFNDFNTESVVYFPR